MYDVIGDVHGQFEKLVALLQTLGYRKCDGAFRHPDGRVAVFVGDLIDRGPLQEEVLFAVRSMVEAGSAHCVMGNHEWNAIGYATLSDDGVTHLRRRSPKNQHLHKAFLTQVGLDSPRHRAWVDWFKTLPPFLDLGGIRVCHAWWDEPRIAAIAEHMVEGRLSEEFLLESFISGTPACDAMDPVTKGQEIKLPAGSSFVDHEGTRREKVRVRWWDEAASTYRDAAMVPSNQAPNLPADPLPPGVKIGVQGNTPVFAGHYWLSGRPQVQSARAAILDYGAALHGPLVAYRWDGETELRSEKLVAVGGWG
jgi:hypothetical protein